MSSCTYNILMYSHDTYGLGHIRRTMAIATHLLEAKVNILIITGSPIVGRFVFPEGIDFVRVPGMIKKSNELYLPQSIRVNARHAMHMRKKIITATAQAFDPSLFIVDKVPLGLKREVEPTLKWFSKCRPEAKVVLGLRDILDNADATRKEWTDKKYFEAVEKYYSEIWVYGMKDLYDPVSEYGFPEVLKEKTHFTGYIPRPLPRAKHVRNYRRKRGLGKDDKHIVVTTGGGGDGYQVLDTYLTMLENNPGFPHKSSIISGPFLLPDDYDALFKRARSLNVAFTDFSRKMERRLASADLVVSMGGYNTVCEILSLKRVSLIIPREDPREEQLIRARVLKEHGLADYIRWSELSPDRMYEKVLALLHNPGELPERIETFPMTGLEVMRSRQAQFRKALS